MEDYPRTLMEFESRFRTEEGLPGTTCSRHAVAGWLCLPKLRRSQSVANRAFVVPLYAGCGRQVSVTAGTIFQGTRKPLRVWFHVMWWVTSQKNGASAKGLQQNPRIGQLPNGLDLAAQAAAGDGSPGKRSSRAASWRPMKPTWEDVKKFPDAARRTRRWSPLPWRKRGGNWDAHAWPW